ncbi:DoxX family protein [Andreprevotia chitinilytica]|uniref:DoxX family protein n=1 Tax=Andreprevotia chitinilytica TaxID=396808 RepID=UPI00068D9B8A|nr:DoxX family protein [Andreprevotia chitinilytica]
MFDHLASELTGVLAPLRHGGGAWLLRAGMAAVFVYSAQDKLRHRPAALAEIRESGLQLPAAMLSGTILVQALGGLMLLSLTPILVALGALMLASFTLVATVLFHRFWLTRGEVRQHQLTAFLEHLVMVSGLLTLTAQQLGAC